MARPRLLRRVILDDLRNVNRWMRWAVGEVDEGGKKYDLELRKLRNRRSDERVENDIERLSEIARGARQVSVIMRQIAEQAEGRIAELRSVLDDPQAG